MSLFSFVKKIIVLHDRVSNFPFFWRRDIFNFVKMFPLILGCNFRDIKIVFFFFLFQGERKIIIYRVSELRRISGRKLLHGPIRIPATIEQTWRDRMSLFPAFLATRFPLKDFSWLAHFDPIGYPVLLLRCNEKRFIFFFSPSLRLVFAEFTIFKKNHRFFHSIIYEISYQIPNILYYIFKNK